MTPIYIVTGFLEAGKTSFINKVINDKGGKSKKILIIQFEEGEENIFGKQNNYSVLFFPVRMLTQDIDTIVKEIHNKLNDDSFTEVWIEWNGTIPFSKIQSILQKPSLLKLCRIEKVVHITNETIMKNILGNTGSALPEQVASSDLAVIDMGKENKEFHRTRQTLRSINPDLELYSIKSYPRLHDQIYVKKNDPIGLFVIQLMLIILAYLFLKPVFEQMKLPINKITVMFIGIILQAFPFLLIGVLLSSAIQVFVTNDFIERRFPKSLGLGHGIIAGFLFTGLRLRIDSAISRPHQKGDPHTGCRNLYDGNSGD